MQKHVSNYLKYFDIGETDVWYCEACMKEFHINNGLQIHHIIYRSHGGTDDVKNCMSLCVKHHDQAHACKIPQSELLLIHNYFLTGKRKRFLL